MTNLSLSIFSSREMFTEHLTSFFRKADKDNSGQLTLKELKIALRTEGYGGSDKQIDVSNRRLCQPDNECQPAGE